MNVRASPKKTSQERFQQNNYLARTIAKCLKTPTHIAALWMFWTYANPKGEFEMSASLLGQLIGVSQRSAQRILRELRENEVIRYADGEAQNGSANRYRITFKQPQKVRPP
jgi:transcription initiation factor IIE alpha subunit